MAAATLSAATVRSARSASDTAIAMRWSCVTSAMGLPTASALAPNSDSAARFSLVILPSPSVTMTGSKSESIAASVVCCAATSRPRSERRNCWMRSAMRLNSAARIPISSRDVIRAFAARSPPAIFVAVAVNSRTGRMMPLASRTASASPATTSAPASARVIEEFAPRDSRRPLGLRGHRALIEL